MGYDVDVHVGVYIKVPKKVTKVNAPVKWFCSRDIGHKVKANYKFCPICGDGIVVATEEQTVVEYIYPPDVDCDDDWFCPEGCRGIDGYAIWLPNNHNDPCRYRFDDVLQVTPTMIQSATALFNLRHGNLVEKLRAMVDGVVVEFGVVQYWH